MGPAPQGQPGPNVGAFLGSPGMASANAGLNNISRMRRGQAPGQNPAAVYSQERRRNDALQERKLSRLDQRKRYDDQERLRSLQLDKAEQDLDPFYAYRQAIEQGLIGPEVSLAEFGTMGQRGMDPGAHAKSIATWEQVNPPPNGDRTDPKWLQARSAALNNIIRPLQIVPTGGGGQMGMGMGGTQQIVDAASATQAEAEEKAAITTAEGLAKANNNFRSQLANDVPGLRNRYQDLQRAMEIIESNNGDFGPAASFLGDVYNPLNSELNAIGLTTLLGTLATVSTGSLSEGEIKILGQDIAKSDKSPASNKALLARALKLVERGMRGLQAKGNYFIENGGSLEGYDAAQLKELGNIVSGLGPGGSGEDERISIPGLE